MAVAFFARQQAAPVASSGGATGAAGPPEAGASSQNTPPLGTTTTLDEALLSRDAVQLSLRIARLQSRLLDLEWTLARSEARLPTREEFGRQFERARAELDRQRAAVKDAAARIREAAAQRGYSLADEEVYEGGPEALWKDADLAAARSAAQLQLQRLQGFDQKLSVLRFTINFGDQHPRDEESPPATSAIAESALAEAREELRRTQAGVEAKMQRFRKAAADAAIPLNAEGLLDEAGAKAASVLPSVKRAWEEAAQARAVVDFAATMTAIQEFRAAAGPLAQKW